jgi:hypothetical protein
VSIALRYERFINKMSQKYSKFTSCGIIRITKRANKSAYKTSTLLP